MADDKALTTEPTTDTAAPSRPLSLLAAELYGSAFHGEVKRPEPPAAGESTELVEPTEPSDAEPAEPTEPAEPAEPAEPEEAAPISSVSELIEHLEADPEWFNGLKVPVKIDGQVSEATLKDLVNSYQIQRAAEHRLEEAKAKAKSIIQEATEKREALEAQFAVAGKLIEKAEAMLDQETKSIDWAKLRADDPAEYSARKADIAEKRERLQEMKREALAEYQKSAQKAREEYEKNLQAHLQKEHELLLEKLPEWQDVEKAKAGKAKLAEYLMNQGFSQQDVMAASDHRLILMARKAMLYDELQANTNAAKKKVVRVPKVLKPGAPKPKEQVSREESEKLRARLKQTGSVDDAFALLKARRKH